MRSLALLSSLVVILAASNEPFAQVSEPSREQMEASQTDGYGVRRGKRKADEEWLEPQRLREEFGRRTSAPASTPASSKTGAGSSAENSQGVMTVPGTSAAGAADRGRGIVTGLGGPGPNPGRGHGHGARGVVNGGGAAQGGGTGSGKGIVSAGGAAPAGTGSPTRPAGAGIVTAGGIVVAPSIAGPAAPGAGIVSGAGGPPGHANSQGHGRGGKR